jgi:mono/diheme cytochrome c family protein
MTKKLFIIFMGTLLFLNLLLACETTNKVTHGQDDPELGVDDDDLLAKGERVFMQNCNECHPNGQEGRGPQLEGQDLSEEKIEMQVRNGVGGMPPFDERKISEEEMEALVAFVMNEYAQN